MYVCNITKQKMGMLFVLPLLPLTGWLQELHPSAWVFGRWTHICLWDLRLWSPVCLYCKFACFHNYTDSNIVILLSRTVKRNVTDDDTWMHAQNIAGIHMLCVYGLWQMNFNKPVTLEWLTVFHLRYMTISVYLCTPLSLSYSLLHPIFAHFFSIKWQTVITFVCVLCLI